MTIPGIGINFAYYAFLGALVGSVALAVVGASPGATVRGITPYVASGYPSCAQVGAAGTSSVTFTQPVNGASSNGIYLLVDSSTTSSSPARTD